MSTVACVYCDAMCLHVFKTENLKRFSLYVSVLYGKPLFMLLLFLLFFFFFSSSSSSSSPSFICCLLCCFCCCCYYYSFYSCDSLYFCVHACFFVVLYSFHFDSYSLCTSFRWLDCFVLFSLYHSRSYALFFISLILNFLSSPYFRVLRISEHQHAVCDVAIVVVVVEKPVSLRSNIGWLYCVHT